MEVSHIRSPLDLRMAQARLIQLAGSPDTPRNRDERAALANALGHYLCVTAAPTRANAPWSGVPQAPAAGWPA